MTIDELCRVAHENSRAHGFWDGVDDVLPTIPEKLCLIHSEISEALEAYRDDQLASWVSGADDKPEGFGAELADAMIRIADLYEAVRRQCGPALPLLGHVVEAKHEYNVSRPYRHGGKKA